MFSLKFKHIKGYLIERQRLHITFDHDVDGIVTKHDPKITEYDRYYVVFVSCVSNNGTLHIHLSETDPKSSISKIIKRG